MEAAQAWIPDEAQRNFNLSGSSDFATVQRRSLEDMNNNIPFRLPHKTEQERKNSDITNHTAGEFYDCTIGPGEVLFFPSQWMHATLNLDAYTYFVSVFLPT